MKNDTMNHNCPVCRVLEQAQNNNQDISLVELKISFNSSRTNSDDTLDWENGSMDE